MRRRPRLRSLRAMDDALSALAARIKAQTRPTRGARHKGWVRDINALLSATSTLAEAIGHVRGAADEGPASAIGYDVDADGNDGAYSEDHGMDVDHDHGAEPAEAATRRPIGFAPSPPPRA